MAQQSEGDLLFISEYDSYRSLFAVFRRFVGAGCFQVRGNIDAPLLSNGAHMLGQISATQPLQRKPLVKRNVRTQTGRRLIDHEQRLFALIGGRGCTTLAQRAAVAIAAEHALAADKARAQFLEDEITAADLLRFQETALAAERAILRHQANDNVSSIDAQPVGTN